MVAMIKNIAVIDMFRNGSGLAADLPVLSALFYKVPQSEIDEAPSKLASLKVALIQELHRSMVGIRGQRLRHRRGDRPSIGRLAWHRLRRSSAQLMGMHPVVAKRHYHLTGTMRWMELSLRSVEQAEKICQSYVPQHGEFGQFIRAT